MCLFLCLYTWLWLETVLSNFSHQENVLRGHFLNCPHFKSYKGKTRKCLKQMIVETWNLHRTLLWQQLEIIQFSNHLNFFLFIDKYNFWDFRICFHKILKLIYFWNVEKLEILLEVVLFRNQIQFLPDWEFTEFFL